MSGKLEKLELRKVVNGKPQKLHIEVVFSPTSIDEEQEVQYRDEKVIGSVNPGKVFTSTPPSVLTFEFTLDGTGANQPADAKIDNVRDSVATIRKITQDSDGKIHEPPWVEVSWGPNIVRGRATHLNVDYTFFKPSGEPLRAEVSIDVERSLSYSEETQKKNMSPPDLTHIASVEAGDTLPRLCHRVYGNSRYIIDMVKHNVLISFRALVPGMELEFPPLRYGFHR